MAQPTKNKKAKAFDEYALTKPDQLSLFEMLAPQDRPYSHTIELYDFMPIYFWGKAERVDGTYLPALERVFECRGVRYTVRIQPASVKDKQGKEKYHYPSKREELVEAALRKFVTEGQGLFLDDEAGVTFSLNQLQTELKDNGHSYSKDELKESLRICAGTNIELQSEDGGDTLMLGPIFQALGLQTRRDKNAPQGRPARAYVKFNSLVTASIKSGSFRRLNYAKSMACRSVIARRLHKRMSHHYTQASFSTPYSINLTTMIRDFGLQEYTWLSHNLHKAIAGLEELKEQEIILNYEIERTLDPAKRNALSDAKITLTPHPRFISEAIEANARQGTIRTLLVSGQA